MTTDASAPSSPSSPAAVVALPAEIISQRSLDDIVARLRLVQNLQRSPAIEISIEPRAAGQADFVAKRIQRRQSSVTLSGRLEAIAGGHTRVHLDSMADDFLVTLAVIAVLVAAITLLLYRDLTVLPLTGAIGAFILLVRFVQTRIARRRLLQIIIGAVQ